jgi:hypothetical protein
VIQQVRPKLACTHCDKIVQAEAPSRPIARGLAGPGLLAHVLVSKYCDHEGVSVGRFWVIPEGLDQTLRKLT